MDGFLKLQRRAVKWILSEQFASYSDAEFISKQHKLDLLPMDSKFTFTDLALFHQIVYKKVNIELPSYITRKPAESVRDRRAVTSGATSSNVDSSNIIESIDSLKFKSSSAPRVDAFKYGFFYRTHLEWNRLPLNIRSCANVETFKGLLKEHLWKLLLEKPD